MLTRVMLIPVNFALILRPFLAQGLTLSQLHIQAMECVVISVVLLATQAVLLTNWEAHRLPYKMKDAKSNFLFKKGKLANMIKKQERVVVDEDPMADYLKYWAMYNQNEVFLNNKLDELLEIFGRRKAISSIELDTGTRLVDDNRLTKSMPCSPRGLAAALEGRVDFAVQVGESCGLLKEAQDREESNASSAVDEIEKEVEEEDNEAI